MIREVLMGLGSFDLQLDSAPWSIRKNLEPYGLFIVTPGWSPNPTLTKADLLSLSRYTGMVRVISDQRTRLEGCHVAVVLGDEDGKGELPSIDDTLGSIFTADTVADCLTEMLSLYGNGLTSGSQVSTTAVNLMQIAGGQSARSWLNGDNPEVNYDTGDIPFDLAWRVNPDCTVDFDLATNLFEDANPPVIFGTGFDADDRTIRVIPATANVVEADVLDWTSTVRVTDTAGTGTATIGSNPYNAPDGNDLVMGRWIEVTEDIDVSGFATLQLGRFDEPRQELEITALPGHDPRRWFGVGDTVYLYFPADGIVDTANQLTIAGRAVFPATAVVKAVETPCRHGFGYYFVNAAGTVYDLTSYVAHDDDGVRIEVGEPPRTLKDLPVSTALPGT